MARTKHVGFAEDIIQHTYYYGANYSSFNGMVAVIKEVKSTTRDSILTRNSYIVVKE
jgi:hypothetical protein